MAWQRVNQERMPRREWVCQTHILLAFNTEFILSASRGSGTYRCLILSWKLKFICIPEVKRKPNKVCFTSYHALRLLPTKPESSQGSTVAHCPDKVTWDGVWRLPGEPGYLIEIKYSSSVRLNDSAGPLRWSDVSLIEYTHFLPSHQRRARWITSETFSLPLSHFLSPFTLSLVVSFQGLLAFQDKV